MMTPTTSTYRYKVGGHLPLHAPSYVVRQADHDLYAALLNGEFCYVLNSRQMGKTSLRVRTQERLIQAGVACAAIDLTKIGSQDITQDQWYTGIMLHLVKSFQLPIQLRSWVREQAHLPPVNRLSELIESVLLVTVRSPIVIFIDEIDSIRSLPFVSDDFLAFIRACDHYERLTFSLFGVTTPADLIQNPYSTPFNIGQPINLHGFEWEEAKPLAKGLQGIVEHPEATLQAILTWSGGQPFLTQKLCQLVANQTPTSLTSHPADWIDVIVERHLIDNWESRDEPPHLKVIRDRLLRCEAQPGTILRLYKTILEQGAVPADDSPEQLKLQMAGLIDKRDGLLRVYNRLYRAVFDLNWVQQALAGLRADFIQVVAQQEQKLLSMLSLMEGQGFDYILSEVLSSIVVKLGEMLSADLVTICLIDQEKNEMWSIVARDGDAYYPEIQILSHEQSQGRLTEFKPWLSEGGWPVATSIEADYSIYHDHVLPLMPRNQMSVAFVHLANKILPARRFERSIQDKLDTNGFTAADKQLLQEYILPVQRVLDQCQYCYQLTQRLQTSEALNEVAGSISQSRLDSNEIIQRVMDTAKKLMNADRSTLWLLDRDRHDLWTHIPLESGGWQEQRLQIGEGYAGQVAATQQPINVPFDLYQHPDSHTSYQTDQTTGYRTCSMLCMPVFGSQGDLLGVTQLINKRRLGSFPEYDPRQWPAAPECFKASFDANSQRHMEVFNAQVGVALQNAERLAALQNPALRQSQTMISGTLELLHQVIDVQGFDEVLYTTLRSLVLRLNQVVNAEHTTVFLLDEERQEFWSIATVSENGTQTVNANVRLPMDQGLVGAVAARKQPMTIPGDRAAEPHLDFTPMVDPTLSDSQGDRSAQRTFSVTALPLLNPAHQLVAVVQVTNKLQPTSNPRAPLVDRVDPNGFTSEDVATLTANTVAIQLVLESFCSYHKTAQGQRVATALMTSTQSSRGRRVDPTELIGRIIEAATDLINADRGTLWLLDGEHQILWTQVLNQAGVSQTLQVPVGQGFAGKVAATATGINVPFDVYNHPESAQAQATDRQSGYRTYSLLCMPIFNPDGDLIGVTQLINKRRSRPSVPPHPGDHLLLPAESYVSFDDSDRKCLHIFNYQVGILLQHAELLATVQQQEAALISPQQ